MTKRWTNNNNSYVVNYEIECKKLQLITLACKKFLLLDGSKAWDQPPAKKALTTRLGRVVAGGMYDASPQFIAVRAP